MPLWVHIALVIVLTAYFIYRFIKDRHIYELLFVIWIPSTLLQYVSSNPTYIRVLGIAQILLFLLVVFFMFRRRGAARRRTAEILASYSTGDLDKALSGMQSVKKQEEAKKEAKSEENPE